MAYTHSLIASATVGSGGSTTIGFTNIPQNYTDLCLVLSLRVTRATAASTVGLTVNGSSSGYSQKNIAGDGANPATSGGGTGLVRIADLTVPANNATTGIFGNQMIYFTNYSSSNNKSISADSVSEQNGTTAYTNLVAALWGNNSPIVSISINEPNGSSNIAQYSTATLYGIRAGEY
jgi:hypothetical protein